MKTIDVPRLVGDWEGMYVRSNIELQNSLAVLPAGTVFKVISTGVVKDLKSKPCNCCGVAVRISFRCARAAFKIHFDFVALDSEGW